MHLCNLAQRCCLSGLVMVLIAATGCSDGSSSGSVSGGTASALEAAVSPLRELPVIPVSNAFDDTRLTMVSGMQRSQLIDNIYYVHNDSGNAPVIYATDALAQVFGLITVTGAASIDWEAIAGMQRDGVPGLVVADIGDNDQQRSDLELLVIEEPQLDELEPGFEIAITARRIGMSYGDGQAYNAEALYVDGDNDTVVVLTKDSNAASSQTIWRGSLSTGLADGNLVLQFAGEIGIASTGLATAITDVDINPDKREIAVLTYGLLSQGRIHLWTARDGEGTTDALTRSADEVIDVPVLDGNLQAEGISYSSDGDFLLVSAEGLSRSILTIVAR